MEFRKEENNESFTLFTVLLHLYVVCLVMCCLVMTVMAVGTNNYGG